MLDWNPSLQAKSGFGDLFSALGFVQDLFVILAMPWSVLAAVSSLGLIVYLGWRWTKEAAEGQG